MNCKLFHVHIIYYSVVIWAIIVSNGTRQCLLNFFTESRFVLTCETSSTFSQCSCNSRTPAYDIYLQALNEDIRYPSFQIQFVLPCLLCGGCLLGFRVWSRNLYNVHLNIIQYTYSFLISLRNFVSFVILYQVNCDKDVLEVE